MGCGEGEGHNRRNDAVGLGEPTFGGISFSTIPRISKNCNFLLIISGNNNDTSIQGSRKVCDTRHWLEAADQSSSLHIEPGADARRRACFWKIVFPR